MSGQLAPRLAVATAAGAMTWSATWSWGGLVERQGQYIGPALVGAILIVVVGTALRSLRVFWPVVVVLQLVVLLVWFGHHQDAWTTGGGWVPTSLGFHGLLEQVRDGASQVNKYAAPVDAAQAQAPVYLLAISLLLMLGVDLIACSLRRAPWAGLPIIVALTVPISVLDDGLPWQVFVVTGVLFAVLLAAGETDRLQAWDQTGDGLRVLGGSTVTTATLQISAVAAACALVLPALVPVSDGLIGGRGSSGGGSGESKVSLSNPLVDLQRDLVRNAHVPLVEAFTDTADPTYLRLTVLDQFNGSGWQPSVRDRTEIPHQETTLPDPPGERIDAAGQESQWALSTTRDFITSWLPAPYSPRSIQIDVGDWRYSPDTLDLASADTNPPSGINYSLLAFTPNVDPDRLAQAGRPPAGILGPMTEVPGLDEEVTRIAQQVTASGATEYDKAVLLQTWFRTAGGFSYSLDQRPGSGMDQLLRFITTDKVGYCEQFAASMAVMARALGIPARVVVGFLTPRVVLKDTYRYTTDDLHAWPEIYFSGTGWVRFEPTPSTRTGTPPAWTTPRVTSPDPTTPSATPSAARPTKAPTEAPSTATPTTTTTGSSGALPFVLVGIVVLVLLLLASTPALVRRGRRRRRLHPGPVGRDHLEALWAELRATMVDLQIVWPQGRSVREVAGIIEARCDLDALASRALGDLVGLVERARYSRDFEPEATDLDRARATTVELCLLLQDTVPRGRVRRARLLPLSVLTRTRTNESDDAHLTAVG